ncbi:hypothetical protein A2914_02425 [Candidatus Nomurabacteria bacterium RIFCSPLOWO2_01_FULL_41_21]|uniref:HicB-like antitoxin of toxin-antitoxin system domain-containing protein n=2 Tax=Candidatus Nomuraibacteriota TaxID=1752729 RepID=A0A1F6V331_9BACT|nr:MAG: hypothetical protein A2733_02440 [Candidatus Nomurabacteria bacterium RIFCSPHIGHO2_01_FULL_40_20]OGI88822.1 MAG: hypothetical protein A2914_02425 [Candidatus Nomurabacteria bacterium RIFCSPLOWO2_01_FULL_41_21]
MKIQRPFNTKKEGMVEILVYKEKNVFVGVCLTFDIVEEGSDPLVVLRSIKEAVQLHLDTVIKNNMSDDLLNRYAPLPYWKKYFEATKKMQVASLKKSTNFAIVSPYQRSVIPEFA